MSLTTIYLNICIHQIHDYIVLMLSVAQLSFIHSSNTSDDSLHICRNRTSECNVLAENVIGF